ncbi:DUF4157 domain-containing protein [Mariniflexile sp.]|uniref:eCIS core domain-containing protein n=1 Tax=Mariniflexile sp. TaxID=1979402 RepID=UPI00356875B4
MRRRYIKPPPSQGVVGDPFIKPKVQTKLEIGKSDDKYEAEADKMADQVVNKTGAGEAVQKTESSEEEVAVQKMEEEEALQTKEEEEAIQSKEEEEAVQMKEDEESIQTKFDDKPVKQPSIENNLKNSSTGSKMDDTIQSEMQQKFGTDFSHIKIHNDGASAAMCQELGAQAFTRGNNIYFNEGKYNPNSAEGKRLLAHELTHTIQQGK